MAPDGPSGTDPKAAVAAAKLPILRIVSPISILAEAQAMRNGAAKYGPYNWRQSDPPVEAMTYIDAAVAHIFSWVDGESVAQDSGVHHLAHAKASLGILIDAIANGRWVDNRPKSIELPLAPLMRADPTTLIEE